MTYLTEAEIAFRKFADDGYNAANVPEENIYGVLRTFAVHLVPYEGIPTWVEQDRRKRTWPWVMADLAARIMGKNHILEARNKRLQEQLIEAKKEISQLKRKKT